MTLKAHISILLLLLLLLFMYIVPKYKKNTINTKKKEKIEKNITKTSHSAHIYYVSKKRQPFYFCENLAKYYPISMIFSSSIPEEICNKSMHAYPPVYCADTIPCKNYDPVTCILHVLKSGLFTVCNKLARCHPNLIIVADTCQKNFVTKLLRHSAHQTWLYMLQLYLVMQAKI